MSVKPLRSDLLTYLKQHNINRKFDKQLGLFTSYTRHPSLNTEILEPKHLKIYSFRIDRKYRAIFIFLSADEIEFIDINDHYK